MTRLQIPEDMFPYCSFPYSGSSEYHIYKVTLPSRFIVLSGLIFFVVFGLKKLLLGNQRKHGEEPLPADLPADFVSQPRPPSVSFILWPSNHNMFYFFN